MKQQIFIAALIHHLTISARDSYDAPVAVQNLQLVNEHIHRLIGHLRAMISNDTEVEDWRISAIEQVVLKLHPSNQQKLKEVFY